MKTTRQCRFPLKLIFLFSLFCIFRAFFHTLLKITFKGPKIPMQLLGYVKLLTNGKTILRLIDQKTSQILVRSFL